ncbi:MAG TPA: alpha-L-fucosidase [Candidatus Latescibacteria bacterium]|mgnify:FL=1|nr:alpha-L-fucosidase [Candidatus Latescibacterota bacterium]HOS63384.1 alpha-L-fucosidase [Candidatus Latescibacterota bacterium]HPK75437.1 alpha-L-fucosidase [Candidatus Latescibacterota bacterium]
MPQMPEKTPGKTDWFVHDRFGMFIHWGLYALPARHEWVKSREMIPDEKYDVYFRHFNPDLYDPTVWAKAAKNAGMKYFVVTTKHHEGFCLWDSDLTDYKATNTPYGKDLLKPMVEAFRAEGLKVGFYHSLIDWHHPEFPVDCMHPMRNDKEFRERTKGRDITKYAEYLHGQTRELLTRFGKIDIMWFDFSYPTQPDGGKGRNDWQSEKLYELVRKLMPDVVLDDRLDLEKGYDIKTPEQWQPQEWVKVDGKPVVWEACQTLNGSWGYDRDNLDWKSPALLLWMLVDSVSKGGNLLLNVGPTGRGEFDERALATLQAIGKWTRVNGRSIYGCTASDYTPPPDCRYTQNGNRLYLHVMAWPLRHLHLKGIADRIEYAQFLHDASEIKVFQNTFDHSIETDNTVVLEIPIQKPNVEIPVIEIFLKDR